MVYKRMKPHEAIPHFSFEHINNIYIYKLQWINLNYIVTVLTMNQDIMTAGNVYCLSNPSMPGLLKFGYTRASCGERVVSLYTTGVPEPFKIEKSAHASDAVATETSIHTILAAYRKRQDREFFTIDIDTAFDLIHQGLPDLVWEEGGEYVRTTKPKHSFLVTFNRINSEASELKIFMEENKWFPNDHCWEAEITNRSDYRVFIEQALKMSEEAIEARPKAVEEDFQNLKRDDKDLKCELKKI